MADNSQNPGRKWRKIENDGDGNRYFDSYRFTPYTTDLAFYRDPNIYETEVARTTQDGGLDTHFADSDKPRGLRRTDEEIKAEIDILLNELRQVDAGDIQVDVKNGVAILSGNVSSPVERQTAEGITGNVLGVLDVRNQLKITPH
jgi:hypothetical protein